MRPEEFIFGYRELRINASHRAAVFDLLHRYTVCTGRQRTVGEEVSFYLSEKDRKRITPELERMEIPYRQGRLLGLPRLLSALMRRAGLLVGCLLAVCLLVFCRSRVWEIRIIGDGTMDEDRIRENLLALGIYEGMPLRQVDSDEIAAQYLRKDPSVSFFHIQKEGVVLEVEWLPTIDGEDKVLPPDGKGANLVALTDATVEEIRLGRGEAAVKVGQVVHAGDLLVSGVRDGRTEYAEGEVLGRVKRQITVTVPLTESVETVVGEKTESLSVIFFGHRFTIGKSSSSVKEISPLWITDHIRLPISFERSISVDTEQSVRTLSESEAITVAMRRLNAEVNAYLEGGELISKSVEGRFENGCYTVTAEIQYLMNIAKTLEFSVEKD